MISTQATLPGEKPQHSARGRRKKFRITDRSSSREKTVKREATVKDLTVVEKKVLHLLDRTTRVDGQRRRHVAVAAQGLLQPHAGAPRRRRVRVPVPREEQPRPGGLQLGDHGAGDDVRVSDRPR